MSVCVCLCMHVWFTQTSVYIPQPNIYLCATATLQQNAMISQRGVCIMCACLTSYKLCVNKCVCAVNACICLCVHVCICLCVCVGVRLELEFLLGPPWWTMALLFCQNIWLDCASQQLHTHTHGAWEETHIQKASHIHSQNPWGIHWGSVFTYTRHVCVCVSALFFFCVLVCVCCQ